MNMKLPLILNVVFPVNGDMADTPLFVVPKDAEFEVAEIIEQHAVAGSDAGAVTLDILKANAGDAVGAGTTILASTFNLKSTADTPVTKDTGSGLAAQSVRTLKAGQRLYANFTGTLTDLAGMTVTLVLLMRRPPYHR